MSPDTIGIIGVGVLLFLIACRVWIGFSMAIVGFLGFAYLAGLEPALGVLRIVPYRVVADYNLSVLPLFLLMGTVASNAGLSSDLYRSAHKWIGNLPGGLAMATVGACAVFAAICGSSLATAVTIGKVALPEMENFKYDPKLATGCVASGATLGILIPPSVGFILFGIVTEQSVGLLFMSGIIPGILLSALFIIYIFIATKISPSMAPKGERTTWGDKILSLKYTWAPIVLFLLVMGGIYLGFFTPTEAGAVGAFGATVITAISGRLTMKGFIAGLMETGKTTAMIMVLIMGAMIFMRFLAISTLPFSMAQMLSDLALNRYVILIFIVLIYLLLGMFLDVVSAILLTIPIIFPSVMALGFDPLWFGVLMVVVMEMGMITPPVGLNVFVLAGVTDVKLDTIFRGVIPFVLLMLLFIVILTVFPDIALILPHTMTK